VLAFDRNDPRRHELDRAGAGARYPQKVADGAGLTANQRYALRTQAAPTLPSAPPSPPASASPPPRPSTAAPSPISARHAADQQELINPLLLELIDALASLFGIRPSQTNPRFTSMPTVNTEHRRLMRKQRRR
jgi:hypothetical protein